jgi:hypothetical protein
MDVRTIKPRQTAFDYLVALPAVAAIVGLGILAQPDRSAAAERLGSCKVCREYNRACLQAHSKQACKSELDMCLKHCKPK